MQGGLEIPCVVNANIIGKKKNKEILAKYLEMVQIHYTDKPTLNKDFIIIVIIIIIIIIIIKSDLIVID